MESGLKVPGRNEIDGMSFTRSFLNFQHYDRIHRNRNCRTAAVSGACCNEGETMKRCTVEYDSMFYRVWYAIRREWFYRRVDDPLYVKILKEFQFSLN